VALVPDLTALAGVAVAGAAIFANTKTSRSARDSQERQAREARLWDKRADAYVQLLAWSVRSREVFNRTHPLIGPAAAPPAAPPEEETILLEAKIKAFGSAEVDALLDSTLEPRSRFAFNAQAIHDIDTNQLTPADARNSWGMSKTEAYRDLHRARTDVIAVLDEMAARVRKELGSPE